MKKIFVILASILALVACDKHDPILPGTRTAIFAGANVVVQNKTITDIPNMPITFDNSNCPYTQDNNNVIWHGNKKIFSGFPTSNYVSGNQTPVCSGKYVYAGLTTGELVKLNPKSRQIIWIADIYRASNLTGGASMVDIIVPVVPYKNMVFVGGLGDAFCQLNATDGHKIWCADIGVAVPFVVTDKYAFVVSVDDYLYAISNTDGAIYWRAAVKNQIAPEYKNGQIFVGSQVFDIQNGKSIK